MERSCPRRPGFCRELLPQGHTHEGPADYRPQAVVVGAHLLAQVLYLRGFGLAQDLVRRGRIAKDARLGPHHGLLTAAEVVAKVGEGRLVPVAEVAVLFVLVVEAEEVGVRDEGHVGSPPVDRRLP